MKVTPECQQLTVSYRFKLVLTLPEIGFNGGHRNSLRYVHNTFTAETVNVPTIVRSVTGGSMHAAHRIPFSMVAMWPNAVMTRDQCLSAISEFDDNLLT